MISSHGKHKRRLSKTLNNPNYSKLLTNSLYIYYKLCAMLTVADCEKDVKCDTGSRDSYKRLISDVIKTSKLVKFIAVLKRKPPVSSFVWSMWLSLAQFPFKKKMIFLFN